MDYSPVTEGASPAMMSPYEISEYFREQQYDMLFGENERIPMFAFGMNMTQAYMGDMQCVGAAVLPNYRLAFRYFADVEPAKGDNVQGVLWQVTRSELRAMDGREGFPFLYVRQTALVAWEGVLVHAVVYLMTGSQRGAGEYAAPAMGYFSDIVDAYEEFGLDLTKLDEAFIARSGDNERMAS